MRPINSLVVFAIPVALACGSDEEEAPAIDATTADVDAQVGFADAANGVVCPGALASYSGMLFSPAAEDDGQKFVFTANLVADMPPDRIRLFIAEGVVEKLGSFTLPSTDWIVSLCIDDSDGTCANELVAVSGTLVVTSVSGRFRANLDQSVYADDVVAPTCSAAVRATSFDVAILGPI